LKTEAKRGQNRALSSPWKLAVFQGRVCWKPGRPGFATVSRMPLLGNRDKFGVNMNSIDVETGFEEASEAVTTISVHVRMNRRRVLMQPWQD
jgi:hypothetical protein